MENKMKILLSPEREVNLYINKALSEDETIQIGQVFSKGGKHGFIADIYLPEGCKNLKIPGKSIVEVKYTFLYDTLYIDSKIYFDFSKKKNLSKTFMLYM